MGDITQVISRIDAGEGQAAEELLPLVYDELRRIAASKLVGEKVGQTLQVTDLVHEAYLRLLGPAAQGTLWNGRAHFLAAAAVAMRRILVERARYRKRQIRGGGRQREELATELIVAPEPDGRLLQVDAALEKLAKIDPEKARLVELRYFAGLTGEQAAALLGISPSTADRDWVYARAWLRREMNR